MGVLGDMEGVLNLVVPLDSSLYPSDRRVLVRAHIDDVVITLILDRTSGIYGLGGTIALDEVLPWACLITE